MSALHPEMVPPEGQVISTSATFDAATHNRHQNNPKPWIGGSVDDKTARVLTKDILFSPRTGYGLARSSKAAAFGGLRAFSVINGAGFAGETKYDFFKRFFYVGLSANMMEPNAIKTDTGIHVAVNVQGMTYMNHNGDDHIRAGDQVMYDLPENMADAQRRLRALPGSEGAIPENRFTAFPRVFRISDAIRNIREDWSRRLRIDRQAVVNRNGRRLSNYPSTETAVEALRRFIAAGAAIGQFSEQHPNDPRAMIQDIQLMANNPQANAWYSGLVAGAYDRHIAALFFPGDREHVVAGRKPQPQDTNVTRLFHAVQRAGFDDLFSVANRAVDEAGRSRIIGRAIAPAKPGEKISILLYGH